MEPHAVALRGVTHTFADVDVLDDVSLTVGVGSFVSIVGPSGCGKSTMLRMLAGLLAPTHGTLSVNGSSAVLRPGLVGYMAQRDLLLPWKRAFDNACIGGDVAGKDPTQTRKQARKLFEQFGLAGFENAWPSQLSGGMRQRLALLRTHLIGADVMLLDEPFGALDAITRRELHTWLQQFWLADNSTATTVVFVTHDVEEALLLSDHVHVMSHRPGRIVETITAPFTRPRAPSIVTSNDFVARKKQLLSALDTNSNNEPFSHDDLTPNNGSTTAIGN